MDRAAQRHAQTRLSRNTTLTRKTPPKGRERVGAGSPTRLVRRICCRVAQSAYVNASKKLHTCESVGTRHDDPFFSSVPSATLFSKRLFLEQSEGDFGFQEGDGRACIRLVSLLFHNRVYYSTETHFACLYSFRRMLS